MTHDWDRSDIIMMTYAVITVTIIQTQSKVSSDTFPAVEAAHCDLDPGCHHGLVLACGANTENKIYITDPEIMFVKTCQYLPGASSLQYSPLKDVVTFFSIPATSMLALATGSPPASLTIPLSPAWTAST